MKPHQINRTNLRTAKAQEAVTAMLNVDEMSRGEATRLLDEAIHCLGNMREQIQKMHAASSSMLDACDDFVQLGLDHLPR